MVLPRLLGEERRFDLALVDGNHRFDGVFLDSSTPAGSSVTAA